MAIVKPGINNLWEMSFNGNAYKRPLKPMTNRLLSLYGDNHPYRIRMIVEQAVYTGHNAFVFKSLPVMKVSDWQGFKVGYCAPKGTIVSCITSATPVIATNEGIGNPARNDKFKEFVKVDENGNIKVDENGNPILSAIVVTDIDGTAFGYDESVTTLMVPANGGKSAVYAYNHALEREVGSPIDSATKAIEIPANIPYGVLVARMWQNTSGRFLNFEDTDLYSPIKDGRFWIPYVDTTKVDWFGTYSADASTGVETIGAGYASVYKEYQFAILKSDKPANVGTVDCLPEAGSLLTSDIYGKFIQQYNRNVQVTEADPEAEPPVEATYEDQSLTGVVNVQTVGRIMTYDNRFPKHMNSTIQAYPGMKIMDYHTKGLPVDLYIFVESILNAETIENLISKGFLAEGSTSVTAQDILNAVQSGAFGMIKVDLSK